MCVNRGPTQFLLHCFVLKLRGVMMQSPDINLQRLRQLDSQNQYLVALYASSIEQIVEARKLAYYSTRSLLNGGRDSAS